MCYYTGSPLLKNEKILTPDFLVHWSLENNWLPSHITETSLFHMNYFANVCDALWDLVPFVQF